jgi:FkbM family methyltransferase
MKVFKQILYKLVSPKQYLQLMHLGFYFSYDLNLLKGKPAFKYHYLIKKIIEPDYVVVDIGANLGYFSKNFARLTPKGKVISIEPIPLFFEVLSGFLKKFRNVEIHNVALGSEVGKAIMVLPTDDGILRTGLPHLAKDDEELKKHQNQEVAIVKGSTMLGALPKIDYVKCDIEGYEWVVFQELESVIQKFKPFVQIEIGHENVDNMLTYFSRMGYVQYGIHNYQFVREEGKQQEPGDYLFVPVEKEKDFKHKIGWQKH